MPLDNHGHRVADENRVNTGRVNDPRPQVVVGRQNRKLVSLLLGGPEAWDRHRLCTRVAGGTVGCHGDSVSHSMLGADKRCTPQGAANSDRIEYARSIFERL